MNEALIIGLTLVICLGVGAQWLAWKLHFPSILLLLIAGFLAGPISGVLIPRELLGNLLFPIVSISVGIILFEGGLSLQFKEIKKLGGIITRLLSLGVLITWIASAAAAHWLLDFPIGMSVLLGAILTVTGPTVIGPLLRHIRPSGEVGPILKWEGIIVDPIGAMLAVLVFEVLVHQSTGQAGGGNLIWQAIEVIFLTIAVGGGVGLIVAALLIFLLKRDWVPDFLQNPVTLMLLIGAFTFSNHLQEEAGLLATTVMGLVLANQKWVQVRHIIEFKETLRTLLISSVFILLAANVQQNTLRQIDLGAFIFLAILIVLIRPISVFASTMFTRVPYRQRVFMALLAPRGIVAAAVGSIFSIRLQESQIYSEADQLVSVLFFVIVGTITIHSLTASPLARALGVAGRDPQGVLIVGAHYWARSIAAKLRDLGIRVVLVDTNVYNISAATNNNLPVVQGNVLDEFVLNKLDLEGIGRLLCLTPNDEVNALATIRFADIFGRQNVYQISPYQKDQPMLTADNQDTVPRELRGRCLFNRNLTFGQISRQFREEARLETLRITKDKNLEDWKKEHKELLEPLFSIDDNGHVHIFTAQHKPELRAGHSLLALVK